MLVEGQLIEVKITKHIIQHYLGLEYDVQSRDIIFVPPEHLTSGSRATVAVICDICGCHIDRTYKQYLRCHTSGLDTCSKCKDVKAKTTCMQKYGVSTHMLVPEIRDKQKITIQERFGVDNISQDDTIKQQKKETCLINHGVENPMFSEDLKNKMIDTNLKKYGVKNAMQNPLIRQRAEKSMLQNFGYNNPQKCPEIKQRTMQTLSDNGTVPTSSQQLKLHKMIIEKYPDAILNYPYSMCALDIYVCINGIKIDVEYDAQFFHNKQKDICRDKFLQSKGFKTLRIRSGHLLPTEEQLFSAINYLITTKHHFKEIVLSDWKDTEEVNPHGDENIA